MKTKFIEAANRENGGFNYGKFMVQQFENAEWNYKSALPGYEGGRFLHARGWDDCHLWVGDLQTGEAAIFRHGGWASGDLNKHKIWVCPLFEPFLSWLYTQDISDISTLPPYVDLDAPSNLSSYRRPGPRANETPTKETDDEPLSTDRVPS